MIRGSDPARRRLLVVDDDDLVADLLVRLLEEDGYSVSRVADGRSAAAAVFEQLPDLVLLDVHLPGMSGFDICRRIKADSATRLIPVVLVTGMNDRRARIEGLEAGADDFLGKPFDAWELRARVRSLLRSKAYTDELESAEAVIFSLGLTIEARDPYTDQHCHRLAGYSMSFGQALGLDPAQLDALRKGGYLHDLGKIATPDHVLLKRGPLSRAEFSVMREHPAIGDRLCGELRSLRTVRPIVRHHHERLNGTGYPDGLSGAAVPLLAQIMGIVDAFDALTTTRPYREALAIERALQELRADVNNGWRDRVLVEEFITFIESRGLTPAMALMNAHVPPVRSES